MEPQASQQSTLLPPIAIGQLIPDVPFQTYADSDGMNASGLKELLRSPAHYYEHRFNRIEEKATPALQFGKLFHYAVLEPKLFQERYVIKPKFDLRTRIGKDSYEKWHKDIKSNAIIVPEEDADRLTRMANKVLNHKVASKMLEKGVRETTFWWNDEETGELCKGRPDFISEKWGPIDLKTSTDARPSAFSRDMLKYSYHIQAAHYLSGARITGVCRSDAFTFLVIEKDPPYEIAVYPAGTSVLGVGEQWRSKGMATYARCKKTNKWPGYNHEAQLIELPMWAEAVDPDDEE